MLNIVRVLFITVYAPHGMRGLKRLYLLASCGERLEFFTFTPNVKLMLLTIKCCTSALAQCTVMFSQFTEEFWLTAAYENINFGDGICTVSENCSLKPSFHKHSQTAVCLHRSLDSNVV